MEVFKKNWYTIMDFVEFSFENSGVTCKRMFMSEKENRVVALNFSNKTKRVYVSVDRVLKGSGKNYGEVYDLIKRYV